MSGRRRHGPAGIAAVLIGLLAMSFVALPVSAASPTVGAPTATVKFLTSISFKGSATLTSDVVRVELVLDFEGSTRSQIADVPTTVKTGSTTLSFVLDTPSGDVLPNTDITARFRLTLADGSTVLGPSTSVHYDDTRYAWKTVSGEFVRVHYTDGGTSFGQRAVKIADDAIREVSSLLGVSEDDPIDFYVYADRTAFYDVLGPATRENVGGEAMPNIRTLFANIEPSAVNDPWVGIVIPHELTHLVFDTAVHNAYHYPPRWLNEGIAVYLSEGYGSSDRNAVNGSADDGSIMPLQALTAQFPTTAERFSLAYSESVSAVSFMVDKYGRDGMVSLVKAYAAGVSDDEAFKAALGTDTAGFEAAWLDSIGAPTPSPFGPQPAPVGPLPSGWGGAAPTAGTAPGDSGNGSAEPSPEATPAPGGAGSTGDGGAIAGLLILVVAVVLVVIGLRRRRRLAGGAAGLPAPGPGGTQAGSWVPPTGFVDATPSPSDENPWPSPFRAPAPVPPPAAAPPAAAPPAATAPWPPDAALPSPPPAAAPLPSDTAPPAAESGLKPPAAAPPVSEEEPPA